MIRLLPKIPIIRRLFDPKSFDFVAVEGLFTVPGFESRIADMLETTCHYMGVNKAMIWSDPNSDLHTQLNHSNLGILSKLTSLKPAHVYFKSYGLSEDQQKELLSHPIYISAIHST